MCHEGVVQSDRTSLDEPLSSNLVCMTGLWQLLVASGGLAPDMLALWRIYFVLLHLLSGISIKRVKISTSRKSFSLLLFLKAATCHRQTVSQMAAVL